MTDPASTAPEARPTAMLCPVCKVGLLLAERQGIEIDYCPQCRGVWLDRGELDKIIERNQAYGVAPTSPSAPLPPEQHAPSPYDQRGSHHGNRSGHGEYREGHRRGGFLGNLFNH